MSRITRTQRIIALTKQIIESPAHLFSLAEFCKEYQVAKSTLSEDIQVIRSAIEDCEFGVIETVSGAAGGIRYLPISNADKDDAALERIALMLGQSDRILPGGFLYMNDILFSPQLCGKLAQAFYTRMRHLKPNYILTLETKGIPIALMVARTFGISLLTARRGSKVTEGSAVSINYVSGSTRIVQTMSLPKRSLPVGARVLIIDDFMRAGGTAQGLMALAREFDATTVGTGVLVATKSPSDKLVRDYLPLFELVDVDEVKRTVDIHVVKHKPRER